MWFISGVWVYAVLLAFTNVSFAKFAGVRVERFLLKSNINTHYSKLRKWEQQFFWTRMYPFWRSQRRRSTSMPEICFEKKNVICFRYMCLRKFFIILKRVFCQLCGRSRSTVSSKIEWKDPLLKISYQKTVCSVRQNVVILKRSKPTSNFIAKNIFRK